MYDDALKQIKKLADSIEKLKAQRDKVEKGYDKLDSVRDIINKESDHVVESKKILKQGSTF